MALDFMITQTVAQTLLTALEGALDAGTAAAINGYDDDAATPANADASAAGSEILFTLVCSASVFTSKTDGAPGAVGTFAAITADSSADLTDTLQFFRILTQAGGTVICQGTAGTATSDMIVNTTSITAGSTVDDTGTNTITVQEGGT
jgi:hypothetical protein